jgi:hypothetical protein
VPSATIWRSNSALSTTGLVRQRSVVDARGGHDGVLSDTVRLRLDGRERAGRGTAKPHNDDEHAALHCHSLALYFVWYNFIQVHTSLKTTPAMATGLTDKRRDMEWIVELVEAGAPKTGRPKKNT